MELKKATRRKIPLKVGLAGTSGSGKTYSALLLARGLATDYSKIAVIDSENGSADLYSDLGNYNTVTLTPEFTPEKYIEAIEMCEEAGMEVIIIDSMSHEWAGTGGILQVQENLGGRYQDWSKVKPRHRKLLDKILQSKSHVIATVRSKQDYAMDTVDGKTKITKLGTKQITEDGFEYELTVSFELNQKHLATTSKDRTGLFMDKPDFVINEETGKKLLQWSNSGFEVPKSTPEQYVLIKSLISKTKSDDTKMKEFLKVKDYDELTEVKATEFITKLKEREEEFSKMESEKPKEDPKMTMRLDEVDLDEIAAGIEKNEH